MLPILLGLTPWECLMSNCNQELELRALPLVSMVLQTNTELVSPDLIPELTNTPDLIQEMEVISQPHIPLELVLDQMRLLLVATIPLRNSVQKLPKLDLEEGGMEEVMILAVVTQKTKVAMMILNVHLEEMMILNVHLEEMAMLPDNEMEQVGHLVEIQIQMMMEMMMMMRRMRLSHCQIS